MSINDSEAANNSTNSESQSEPAKRSRSIPTVVVVNDAVVTEKPKMKIAVEAATPEIVAAANKKPVQPVADVQPVAAVQPVADVQPVAAVKAVQPVKPLETVPSVAPVAEKTPQPKVVAAPVVAKAKKKPKQHQPNPKQKQPNDAEKVLPDVKLVAESVAAAAEREKNRVRFADLPLSAAVQKAVAKSGYEFPTEIQEQIIPHMLDGRDVMAQSQTGSGKTAAFALPILTQIDTSAKLPQVLVLAPTRELAIQVAEAFNTYAANVPKFASVAIYGGQDYEIQFRQLRKGVQVVVGTPGRVIDHIKRGTLKLDQLKTLVLDEADEMLNMGFLDDVKFVLDQTPKDRQVTLFSATFNSDIKKIAQRYLNNPIKITVQQKTATADSIRQRAIFCPTREKIDLLIQMLEVEKTDGVLIFTRTKDATISVAEQLNRAGLRVAALNGDMPQKTRERTIERLKAERLDIVVATDVAARGLDVTRVSHVFNYDLPEGSESYIHRIGRTGRAGRKGEAIIFLTHSQRGRLRMIERATRKTIEIVEPPSAKQLNEYRVTKFRESISEAVSKADLNRFEKLIETHAEETGESMLKIAAALAHMGQRGAEFFSTDKPKRQRVERGSDRGSDGEDRGARGRRKQGAPPESGMERFRIEVGHKDGVKPGNIVGAIANEAGIEGKHIGPIQIYGAHSTIDLPSGMPEDVHHILQGTRVVGRELKLRKATAKDEVAFERGAGGARGRGGDRPQRGRFDRSKSSSGGSGGGRGDFRKKRKGGASGGRSFSKVKGDRKDSK